jgi:hypothetical protein
MEYALVDKSGHEQFKLPEKHNKLRSGCDATFGIG